MCNPLVIQDQLEVDSWGHFAIKYCLAWREAGHRRLIGRKRVGDRLHTDIVADIFNRVGRWIGVPDEEVEQVGGRSLK